MSYLAPWFPWFIPGLPRVLPLSGAATAVMLPKERRR